MRFRSMADATLKAFMTTYFDSKWFWHISSDPAAVSFSIPPLNDRIVPKSTNEIRLKILTIRIRFEKSRTSQNIHSKLVSDRFHLDMKTNLTYLNIPRIQVRRRKNPIRNFKDFELTTNLLVLNKRRKPPSPNSYIFSCFSYQ